jgi:hypothetical protein
MSTRSPHRIRSAGVVLASAVVLVAATGSVAAADPPALNRDSCATALVRAASWPSTSSDDIRLVSDGFVTHLSQQSPCDSDPSSTL